MKNIMYVNKQFTESSTKVHTDIEMSESGEFYNQCIMSGDKSSCNKAFDLFRHQWVVFSDLLNFKCLIL